MAKMLSFTQFLVPSVQLHRFVDGYNYINLFVTGLVVLPKYLIHYSNIQSFYLTVKQNFSFIAFLYY